ncbi:hypothetical protein LJ707_01365 [Mucilaginibacter sp. UR6-1]|uniref:hypothetical protein n=1 Tax=Mucilaginibacter sp. UR6-1 TaxID=1435643 RepID=UPI001E447DEE|nr:hypothetical protein [Mucilaginibacter sp. UR6-1]MCC8407560.1 hypothetical protein [Mucilaginibacter sp. UR6-1]
MKKGQDLRNTGNFQGNSIADRAFNDSREVAKSKGITNGGAQRADQTSNRDNIRKQENKK